MRPETYALQFRGRVTDLGAGRLRELGSAPNTNTLLERGEKSLGEDARLEAELEIVSCTRFRGGGTIAFGRGDTLRFRTCGVGLLAPSPEPRLLHGTAIYKIDGGDGVYRGATGRIAVNFFVSDTGEVTSNHLGAIFRSDDARREG